MMCRFCSPLPASAEDVELTWFHELVESFGFNPTPQPEQLEIDLERVEAEVTQEVLRPALEAARVASPQEYTVEFNRDRITARRPWVRAEALDATQSIPVIQVDSL